MYRSPIERETSYDRKKHKGDLEEVVLCQQELPAVVVALRQVLVHIVPQALLDLLTSLTPTNIRGQW